MTGRIVPMFSGVLPGVGHSHQSWLFVRVLSARWVCSSLGVGHPRVRCFWHLPPARWREGGSATQRLGIRGLSVSLGCAALCPRVARQAGGVAPLWGSAPTDNDSSELCVALCRSRCRILAAIVSSAGVACAQCSLFCLPLDKVRLGLVLPFAFLGGSLAIRPGAAILFSLALAPSFICPGVGLPIAQALGSRGVAAVSPPPPRVGRQKCSRGQELHVRKLRM